MKIFQPIVTLKSTFSNILKASTRYTVMVFLILSCSEGIIGQTAIGGLMPDPSAMLDVQSNNRGVLFPTMTTEQRMGIIDPANSLMIFNISTFCLEMNFGSPTAPYWIPIQCRVGAISTLDCSNARQINTLIAGQEAVGVSVRVPYTGGNLGTYASQSVPSMGVLGLTAVLTAGTLANGSDSLTYTISGTALSDGTASFSLTIGGQSCVLTAPVAAGEVGSLNFSPGQKIDLPITVTSSGTVEVTYTGANGGSYDAQTVPSSGISGLTATLAAGNFSTGSGSLSFTISGTGNTSGTASFPLNIGGQSLTMQVKVNVYCWAKTSATDTLRFMCHNLASADTTVNPLQPSWQNNGGYWRWGWKGPAPSQWLNTNTDKFMHGPTGGTEALANSADDIWNPFQNPLPSAPDGAWLDNTKTTNDPCPDGYRVPTINQWIAVKENNAESTVGGSWIASATNYANGRRFGPGLMLPAAGVRNFSYGDLEARGQVGSYWSSTEFSGGLARYFNFVINESRTTFQVSRLTGYSVRCVAQ